MADHKSSHSSRGTEHQKEKGKGSHASAAGEKGVTQDQVGSGKEKDPNNFANDPSRASAAGKKGGHNSH
jgi:general stress protein YciG